MRKLFLSFSALLPAIVSGQISQEDLDNGFFMFGCHRTHALDPGSKGERDERQGNNGTNAKAHPTLVKALLTAELEHRCAWMNGPNQPRQNPFVAINLMLMTAGLPAMPLPEEATHAHYSYPGIEDYLREVQVPLIVIR